MDVRLTAREMSQARQCASLRWQLARASGVKDQRRDPDRDLDLLGVKAEMAVSKLFHLDFNPAAMGIDDGADLWFGDVSIDVKASFTPSARLLFKTLDAFKAHVGILVTAHADRDDVMCVVGGIGQARFKDQARQVDLGRGPCFVMDQHELTSVKDMWEIMMERMHG